ncbi:hypothetical protein [Subtercola vilae]|uniref:hypothetical protein n=1 Tax=Subtercola vilae TaxID=2056433 RepID=UPI0013758449|nr:hypothetical protein [Subtercola vilae]
MYPEPADWFGFAIIYGQFHLYYDEVADDWAIADGGGWLDGVFASARLAIEAHTQ